LVIFLIFLLRVGSLIWFWLVRFLNTLMIKICCLH
jgi:hypothetical protein